jgi:hypothetical protein
MVMYTRLKGSRCRPYRYSSDTWSGYTVKEIDRRAARHAEEPGKEHSAGVVIGPGGLLYLLGHASHKTMTQSDLHEEVFEASERRFKIFRNSRNWNDYQGGAEEGLSRFDRHLLRLEISNARDSGLMGDFEKTQQGLEDTIIEYELGDFRMTAANIGARAKERDEVMTLVNLTNATLYAGRFMCPDIIG